MGITLGTGQGWCWSAGRRNRGKMSQEQTWKSLVYNTNITPDQVHTFYKTWAETYEEDMNKLQFHSAGLLADMLTDALSRGGKNDVSKLRVLDVACGTGTVGDALARRGYRSVAGLDFSREMLDRAFDCVVMMGGFAAGHIPLASFSTMARLCKPGGIVINMMTQKYTKIVEEYRDIDKYVFQLADEGRWWVEERREIEKYGGGNRGLVHLLRIQ